MKKTKHTPPLLGEKLLRLFASENERETIIGDIEEWFDRLHQTRGAVYARLWYWFQILKAIFVYMHVFFYWEKQMLKNYVKIAFRNIKRQKNL